MSKVRVLVGTRKGAFVLTSDGKREQWDVSGPHFAGWEIYHLKGSPVDPNRIYASQSSGWFGQVIQRSNDGGKTWETPGGEADAEAGRPAHRREQQVRLRHFRRNRQTAHHASVVRRHAASVGVQARLASGTVAHRSGRSLCRSGRRRVVSHHGWRADLAGACRIARPRHRTPVAAWRRRDVPAHDYSRSEEPEADLHRHLGGGRVSHRRWRQDLAADQSRAALAIHSRPERRRSATAFTISPCILVVPTCCSCRNTGT